MAGNDKYLVPVEQLKAPCRMERLCFKTTEEITPLEGMIGQDRARKAIEFGLKIKNNGYNIFVAGLSGTGKTTSVEAAVRKIAENQPTPDDWCYVYNFDQPDNPRALRLPAGKATVFKKEMATLVEEMRMEVPRAFESKMYELHRNEIVKDFQKKKDEAFKSLEENAKKASFVIEQKPNGIFFVPALEGKALTEQESEQLTPQAKEEIRNKQEILAEQLNEILRTVRDHEKQAKELLGKLEAETALFTIHPRIGDLKEKCKDFPDIIAYLEKVERDMIGNVGDFQEKKETETFPGVRMPKETPFVKYEVNVFVSNTGQKGAPVLKEVNPTAYNLSGKTEYRPQWGGMVTDFTLLKPGALHLANGGYLIVQVLDLLRNYFAWETLKRAIKGKEIVIEDINEQFRLINTPTLKPQPIPADIKIILIGNPIFYYLLHAYDDDFPKLFKVKADFSSVMERDDEGVKNYAAFISRICREEGLRHFDQSAVARIVEYASRSVENQEKLTTRFIDIADLAREATFWADDEGNGPVSSRHVQKAFDEKVSRSNLIEERLAEMIRKGVIMVDTEGSVVGQINGLSVIPMPDYSFGKPSRITISVSVGRGGMINIDREVRLSGAIHNKGFLILSGYIGQQYGTKKPLVFAASVCFEQMYDEIEGDSASSTELYGLLSALAGLPINQGIAVTGSVNQKGEVQAIGGVNEKIEGFYYTCKSKRITGEQGVVIPAANIKNLMLNDEVIEAVKKGDFRIWAVNTIDEGIEILTGVPAGARRPDGSLPRGTVHARVADRLDELTRTYLTYQTTVETAQERRPRTKKRRRRRILKRK